MCTAIDWTTKGAADGIVTLPLHKEGLHAAGLHFPHPVTGAPVEVDSPLPEELAAFLREHEAG